MCIAACCVTARSRISRLRYSSHKLLEAVQLGCLLRGGSTSLVEVVKRSLSLALPAALRVGFMEEDKLITQLPSSSMLSRHQLSLDIAII